MTEAECEQSFEVVSGAMRTAKLEWVLTQVDEQIRFGKPATKRVQTTLDASPEIAVEGMAGRAKKTRETFAFTCEYTVAPTTRIERVARIDVSHIHHAVGDNGGRLDFTGIAQREDLLSLQPATTGEGAFLSCSSSA